jgi:20S proteasome alpha/beta subunit
MYEDPITIEPIARYIATLQLQSTQFGGKRPFGVTTLVCGFVRQIHHTFTRHYQMKLIQT